MVRLIFGRRLTLFRDSMYASLKDKLPGRCLGLFNTGSFTCATVASGDDSQRVQELGVGTALDAMRITRLVVSQGVRHLAIEPIVGSGSMALVLRFAVTSALNNILFKANPLDPIYLTVAALLTVVAAASCLLPTRRATVRNY